MCGIAGVVDRPGADASGIVRRMTGRLSQRGPEDAGIAAWPEAGVALGHRRLSILDLSAAGHQPMPGRDGLISLVFNGEIYNFQTLRHELEALGHQFFSHSDTEVIVRAYEQWGVDCVPR